MSREILFRGKRIDDGEWIKGFLFSTVDHTYIAYKNQFDDDLFLSPKEIFIEVAPATVCQYTGLIDKNGREIFEGDIVGDAAECRMYKMIWIQEDMRYYIEDENGEQWDFDSNYSISLEVAGNVFDNPELLTRKE